MTKEHEIWPKYSLYYIVYKNVLDVERIQKNIALEYLKCQSCLLGRLCNIEFFCKLGLDFSQILCDQGT